MSLVDVRSKLVKKAGRWRVKLTVGEVAYAVVMVSVR